MRVSFELDASIAGIAEQEIRAAERAVTGGVREVGGLIKKSWRGQVTSSGLGQRLANAIRQRDYPSGGESIGAASLVYAQPNRKKSASAADLVDVFDRGALITRRAVDADHLGVYLAIPLPAAGPVAASFRRGRLTPGQWEQRTGRRLRFVYRRGQPSLLVDDGTPAAGNPLMSRMRRGSHKAVRIKTFKNKTVPMFLLVPQVKLRKRLNLDEAVRAGNARLAAAVLQRWK
ncbi:MAG TPA: DUF6441 family protein [Novosphingobium sp.]|jgi:hypothetical protein|nr:DUF6441 family protein [Novosphingobium sp.]